MLTLFFGFIRFFVLWLVMIAFFVLEGGHVFVLVQPFEIFMQVGFSFACVIFFCGTLNPQTEEQRLKFFEAGRASFVLNLIVPALLGIIHTLGMLNAGTELIGQCIGASLVSLVYAPLIYFSFFKWADPNISTHKPNHFLDDLKVPTTRSKKINTVLYSYYYASMVMGALVMATFATGVVAVILYDVSKPEITYEDRSNISLPAQKVARTIASIDPELQPACRDYHYTDQQERKIRILEFRQQRLMDINEVPLIDY